jgi:hypothetical protein
LQFLLKPVFSIDRYVEKNAGNHKVDYVAFHHIYTIVCNKNWM